MALLETETMVPVKLRTEPRYRYRPTNQLMTMWRHVPSGAHVISSPVQGGGHVTIIHIKQGELVLMKFHQSESQTHAIVEQWWQGV